LSPEDYQAWLKYLQGLEGKKTTYHLVTNNCATFVVKAAEKIVRGGVNSSTVDVATPEDPGRGGKTYTPRDISVFLKDPVGKEDSKLLPGK
jgi:hypothetical protein